MGSSDSGAGLIKARHPEFEMWNQGVHARSGVACADCHMPYMRQGGLKISDHHVNSPLLKINRSCQTCHHFPEEELKARVEDIQDTFFNLRNSALDALVDLINDIKTQKAKGATDAQIAQARDYQRKGQFMIDFVMSENSMGFHAPQEATRILKTRSTCAASDNSACTEARHQATIRRTSKAWLRAQAWQTRPRSKARV